MISDFRFNSQLQVQGDEGKCNTFCPSIPILHDKNDTRLINFLLLIGFTKSSADLHEFLFRKEPAAGSDKNEFLDRTGKILAF
ncbi:hypothetical protein ACFP7D_003672 [Proteus mirabilis]